MNKIATQNEAETEELPADDATARGGGSTGVTTAHLHVGPRAELVPSSLRWCHLEDDLLCLPETLVFSLGCINRRGCKFQPPVKGSLARRTESSG